MQTVWLRGKGSFDLASHDAAEILALAYEYVVEDPTIDRVYATSMLLDAERHVLETGRVS